MATRDEIRQFLTTLRDADWMSQEQRDWTRFLFHFTDITNVGSILESFALLPRDTLELQGTDFHNSASQQILNETPREIRDKVRLYFRPRVPMLHVVEGFNVISQIGNCPVPVYLLFDSESVLALNGTLVSRGNCGKISWQHENRPTAPVQGLVWVPFQSVFHDDVYEPHDRERIVFHRQAEVLVQDRLDLAFLKWIFVRSQGELQTLRALLDARDTKLWLKFGARVKVNTKMPLFNRHRIYVENVRRLGDTLFIQMNSQTTVRGPINFEIVASSGETRTVWRDTAYTFTSDRLKFQLPVSQANEDVRFELRLNDHLAFSSSLEPRTRIRVIGEVS